ncbi:MAG: glycosyl hydrolase 115 family protein [Clostridia bacterium]|nr:glycosyl hydrolase 115 family protein [Clostridia bacterium]
MSFVITSGDIKCGKVAIVCDNSAMSGVKKIALTLINDIEALFGAKPSLIQVKTGKEQMPVKPIVIGTVGNSALLDKLQKEYSVELNNIRGKREVYIIREIDGKLIIAGSDKRGTIYGMFALSEMMGVSPLINWMDIKPTKIDKYVIKTNYEFVSKEPSVRFRGFFINDEWPAFGNFCKKRFGGFNCKVYEQVFELLLRLKGNYLWPAMWSAIFPDDGPGLESAILADELGVVMGASHHEPCLRQGEEYKYLRGKDSPYGDAWNFIKNRDGITRFWEDGLKRSGKFENVITVGMRGEADTAIMGKEATLEDNINLLRDVLKTQNSLIKKYVNEDLDSVPRMLALYKEVEPYFYGDDKTPGLMGDPELDGVTLMLCDDNYGNLRTLPTEEMRNHKGGYGMYYHFDYHGLPISFEWFNTSFLPKIWEQMTTAYDFGVRDLWIVNVGDIFSNEFPLSYFLNMAYDFEKWGTSNAESPKEYTRLFSEKNFRGKLSTSEIKNAADLIEGYTKITNCRRTEAMNDKIYAPAVFGECNDKLEEVNTLIKRCEAQRDKLLSKGNRDTEFAYYELLYLPLTANLNVQKMWLLTTLNHYYASIGSTYALTLADEVEKCIAKDKALVAELHKIKNGKWYGMGLSEHIGFKYWCEEECEYPIIHSMEPANKKRLIATIPGTNQHTEGGVWTGRVMTLGAFLNPDCSVCNNAVQLSTASAKPVEYTIESNCEYVTFSTGNKKNVMFANGKAAPYKSETVKISIDRDRIEKNGSSLTGDSAPVITIKSEDKKIDIRVPVICSEKSKSKDVNIYKWCAEGEVNPGNTVTGMPSYTRVLPEGARQGKYIAIEAENYSCKNDGKFEGFKVIENYGRTISGIKAYPQNINFFEAGSMPSVTYKVDLPKAGKYTLELHTNPSNPCVNGKNGQDAWISFGLTVNKGDLQIVKTIEEGFAVGDGNMLWQRGVLDNVRRTYAEVELKEGINTLTIHAVSPNFVLTKLIIYQEGTEINQSYLGPKETYKLNCK